MTAADAPGSLRASWTELWGTPLRLRLYLCVVALAALALPLLVDPRAQTTTPAGFTVIALILVSVLNVELSRALAGGLARTHQPHKALSAWAFASALLLPPVWLLVVVPVTYAHARWRGIRLPLWKWVGSAFYLILAGMAAAGVRHALFNAEANWMAGDGGRGFLTLVAAALAFLGAETLLFTGSALLNRAEDEVWLRAMLTDPTFYFIEAGVLLVGGLFSAVWTGGPWFTLLFIPIYTLVQHAVLLAPLRERANVAIELSRTNKELAAKNAELEREDRFKADLIGMLGHEIGNPLTAVSGYAQVGAEAAIEGDLDAARSALVVVERNAEQMRAVLHDILTLVSSERGELKALPEPCQLAPRLLAAAAELPPARRPQVSCPEELAALVQPGHLDQILANLLINAEKYAGGATRLTAADVGRGRVELSVVDNGPGVPATFREQLFQRFARDAETSGHVLGSGLGLFISRELARANGGDLEHRDGRPVGSVFVLCLAAHESA